jgi:hypothetical protein
MKGNRVMSSLKFPAGVLVGILMFSGSAMAFNNYVSDNTPANGYLLCANKKTKVVTFPNKSTCPAGTKALDLGAVTGVEGPEGPAGPPGSDATLLSGYVVTLASQDVIASVTSKVERVLISKSKLRVGHYNLTGEIAMQFQSTNQQVVLCKVDTSGNSSSYSAFPSHELANTWTGYNLQVMGLVTIASENDSLEISCNFTGNTKVLYGYLNLTPTGKPNVISSDPVS